MKHHYLKILPEYYEAVKSGDKTFEVRKNDRDFKVDDVVHLQEYTNGEYTGNELVKVISYVLDNVDYCKEGYVVFALKDHYICTKKMCPMQVGTVDNCTLTPLECPYFTKELKSLHEYNI